jgi:transaldolase
VAQFELLRRLLGSLHRVDNITIAPKLLAELEASPGPLERKLWPAMSGSDDERINLGEDAFGLFNELHGADQMAVDKLKEGVDSFAADQGKLEALIGAAHAA